MAFMTGYNIRLHHTPLRLGVLRGAFFYHSHTKLDGHFAESRQFPGDMFSGQDQSHKIKAQHLHLEGLMVLSEDSVRQIIEAFLTLFTLITLFGKLLLIETSSDDSHGITIRTRSAFWSTQFAHSIGDTGHHISCLLCLPAFVGLLIMGRGK
jgi:hypothetical protein